MKMSRPHLNPVQRNQKDVSSECNFSLIPDKFLENKYISLLHFSEEKTRRRRDFSDIRSLDK